MTGRLITAAHCFVAIVAIGIMGATGAMAQHAHKSGRAGETGQAQFAAIAEVVTRLRADPQTNWAKVNIQALRDHLVDMDNVTTKAVVAQSVEGLMVRFDVTGDAMTAASIQRMVRAHSPMLAGDTGWDVSVTPQADGARMEVIVASRDALDQVTGLGFFGLMTIGAHHQHHHMMIAQGGMPH